jgi:hypothetical protein
MPEEGLVAHRTFLSVGQLFVVVAALTFVSCSIEVRQQRSKRSASHPSGSSRLGQQSDNARAYDIRRFASSIRYLARYASVGDLERPEWNRHHRRRNSHDDQGYVTQRGASVLKPANRISAAFGAISAQFSAQAMPGDPETIAQLSGDAQVAVTGTRLRIRGRGGATV